LLRARESQGGPAAGATPQAVRAPLSEEVCVPVIERLSAAPSAGTVVVRDDGLGLAIVDRLASAQGATVTVANDPAGGARFTVHIPNPLAET
jgi:hypothetical protein